MYPPNWPTCPVCGDYVVDGHLTCGKAECSEAEQRVRWQHGMLTKEEVEEVLNDLQNLQS